MKLVPYTYSSLKRNEKVIHIIRVLLEGNKVWQEANLVDPIQNALEPNGLFATKSFLEADHRYFQIDETRTDMASMFDYRECEPDTDILCWNTHYVITNEANEPWFDIPYPFLRPILKAHHVE